MFDEFKKSDRKKYNSLMEEAEELKLNNKFLDSVRAYQEVINLIRVKVKEREERNEGISQVQSKINSVHSAEIEVYKNRALKAVDENDFEKGYKTLDDALDKTKNLTDHVLRDMEKTDIRTLKKDFEIEELKMEASGLIDSSAYDEAVEKYKKSLDIAKTMYDTEPEDPKITVIKDLTDNVYLKKTKDIISEADSLKKAGKLDEAIKKYEEAKEIPPLMFDTEKGSSEVEKIKHLVNSVISEKINPVKEKGKTLVNQQEYSKAIETIKKAIDLAEGMYDLMEKENQLDELGRLINPVISEQVKPIIENGKKIMNQEDFAQKIPLINDAVKTFSNAMNFVDAMVESEEKEAELKSVRNNINEACMAGIKIRKQKGLQLIAEKDFDKAISELYSALSLAKDMVDDPDREDPLTEEDYIKKVINQVYSAEIRENYLKKGQELIKAKQYDDAIDIYKKALKETNKMYLGEEMDKEVSQIKNMIYQTEIKKVVADGNVSAEQLKFQEEIEKLRKKLDEASRLTDPQAREDEMYKIRKGMDDVHSEEIDFLITQGTTLTEEGNFQDAGELIDKALDVINLIEFSDAKNEVLLKLIQATIKIGESSITIENHALTFDIFENAVRIIAKLEDPKAKDNEMIVVLNDLLKLADSAIKTSKWEKAFNYFERSIELGNQISNDAFRDNEVSNAVDNYKKQLNAKALLDAESQAYDQAITNCEKAIELDASFLDSYYNLANVYKVKGDYDNAIQNYKKALEINPEHVKALNDLALAHELKNELDNAIFNLKKAVSIEPQFKEGWCNLGNIYKKQDELDQAIGSYQRAIEIDSNDGKAWFYMGCSYYEKKDYDTAFEYLQKGIELEPPLNDGVTPLIDQFDNARTNLLDKLDAIFQNK